MQQPQARKPQCNVPTKAKMSLTTDLLREVVVRQVDAAIVHKHREMSLIDQQIAKCQIALEQIRRCQLIPFPGALEPSLAVASHSGPALVTPAGLSAPSSPAPWGVVDGPYTRHYAKWLIPSPTFDAQLPQSATAAPSPFQKDMRATRGSGVDLTPLNTTSARSSRNSTGRARSMFDPHSPTAARDPLVIKRTQDGEMVKLYCSHCMPERSDFANVQGFLNHCRISHRLEFKSHEEAAIKCGRVVKPTDGMKMPEAPTPRDSAPKSIPTSFSADRPLVNPLNKNTLKERFPLQQIVPRTYSADTPSRVKSPLKNVAPSTFVPSPQTPHLSSLLQKRAFGGNLASIVTDAKQKVDLSFYDDSDSDLDVHSTKRSKSSKKNGSAPARAINKKTPPTGLANATPALGRAKPMSMGSSRTAGVQLPPIRPPTKTESPTGSPASTEDIGLSPHTADSNPGLVSDRDDDDDVDEEDSPSEHQRGSHHGEMDPDVMMVDIEDSDVEGRSTDRHSQGFCNRNSQGSTGIGC
jgi:ADA HAT complex component 1